MVLNPKTKFQNKKNADSHLKPRIQAYETIESTETMF